MHTTPVKSSVNQTPQFDSPIQGLVKVPSTPNAVRAAETLMTLALEKGQLNASSVTFSAPSKAPLANNARRAVSHHDRIMEALAYIEYRIGSDALNQGFAAKRPRNG